MNCQLSVVLPVRSPAPHLRSALRTILWQRHVALEVVVVDDGLDAVERAGVTALAAADSRVHLRPNSGRGLCAALNHGIEVARGDMVARMDADDLCHPRRLDLQCARLLQGDVGVVGCQVRSFPRSRVTPRWRAYDAWLNSVVDPAEHERDLFVESPLCHPSVVTWRALLLEVGGYREGDFPEDYDLWLRLSGRGVALGKVARPLFLWRDSDGRMTRCDGRYRPGAFRALKARHLVARFDLTQRGVIVWGAGKEGKALGRCLAAAGAAPLSYVDVDPRKVGGQVGGAPVVDPRAAPWRTSLEPLVVVAVGTPGARPTVRAGVRGCGLVEGRDFVIAA